MTVWCLGRRDLSKVCRCQCAKDTQTAFVPPNVTDEPFTESNALPALQFPVPGLVIPGRWESMGVPVMLMLQQATRTNYWDEDVNNTRCLTMVYLVYITTMTRSG